MVIDQEMPELSGTELIKKLRNLISNTNVDYENKKL